MKKVAIIVLAVFLISSTTMAYADVADTDVNYFLDGLADSDNGQLRETGAALLELYYDDNKEKFEVDAFKEAIKPHATSSQIEKIENAGYTLDEALDSLNVLKDASADDIKKLADSIRNQDKAAMKDIADKFINKEDESSDKDKDKDSGTGGGGGGGSSAAEPEVTPEPEKLIEVKFDDIETHWAKDNIKFLAERQIINGYSDMEYAPEKQVSKAEFTKLVVSLLNIEEGDTESIKFEDINSEDWFYTYVKKAQDKGLIYTQSEVAFNPNEAITREHMIYMVIKGLESTNLIEAVDAEEISLDTYTDKATISEWAVESLKKAVDLKLIKGREDNNIAPQEPLTRAEAATIIRSVYDLINK